MNGRAWPEAVHYLRVVEAVSSSGSARYARVDPSRLPPSVG